MLMPEWVERRSCSTPSTGEHERKRRGSTPAVDHPVAGQTMLKIAEEYEKLAERAEARARSQKPDGDG
jgi:hypothetical protein